MAVVLSEDQREAAVAWFEKGVADRAAARLLGVPGSPVKEPIGGGGSMAEECWWPDGRNSRTRSSSSSRWSNGSSRAKPLRISRRRLACHRPGCWKLGAGLSPGRRGRVASEAERQTQEARRPATGDVRAGTAAPGERTSPGGSGLPGKIAGLEGAGTTVKVQAVIALKADFPPPGTACRSPVLPDRRSSTTRPASKLPDPQGGAQGRSHGDFHEEPRPIRAPPHPRRTASSRAGRSRRRPC